jgi:hypothetical protein
MENGKLKTENRTETERETVKQLADTFGIDPTRIIFFEPNKPWIPSSELMGIARTHGKFTKVSVGFGQYIEATKQTICTAEIVDAEGRTFSNFGIASDGEHEQIDSVVLASGRALSATLNDAGFNPLKTNSKFETDFEAEFEAIKNTQPVTAADKRLRDIRTIKSLATEAGLIVDSKDQFGKFHRDETAYRGFLFTEFPGWFDSVEHASAGILDAMQRQMTINKLVRKLDSAA